MTLFEIKAYSSKAYCWLAQVIVLSFVCCALANASNIPAVKITLCDTADRPESYRGKFLKNFKTLQKRRKGLALSGYGFKAHLRPQTAWL